ncbi:response regulator transcription factor [Sulfurovum sp. NBC37-1]|uniref:response regulator transcription factor n=1 Tax=Sulfurovum sp. (strain NBC37-1) TaxID=387093 RepID=UPI0001587D9C|nr:response regulator transcription factor [Sulfurovum sp. NBC37-1]BAF72342.1 two-component response regulator [Sulfurovum sp. NBC37-1]
MQRKILLLEDDLQLNDTVKQFLEHHQYTVLPAYDGHQAKDLLYETDVDLMLLDIKVPQQSGFDLLSDLRKEGNDTPAIFITSLHSIDDVSKGFDIGCDDYIRKPFALKELLVRIEAQLRKRYGSRDNHVDLGNGLNYYPKEFRLALDGNTIPLKHKEAKLLALLLEHPNQLVVYDKIHAALWEFDEEPSAGSLRTYIKTLRSHLGKDRIETVKNIGYRFVSK